MGLHFKTFGVPELLADGQRVVRLRYRKAYALLGYLVVEHNRWHERRQIAHLLWPRLAPEAARANLRLVLKSLADTMTGVGNSGCLKAERERVGLFFDASFSADVFLLADENRKLLRQCADHGDSVRLLGTWQAWLDQMQGEFLDLDADENGAFEDWLVTQRAFYERARGNFLHDCAAMALRCGAREQALAVVRAWVRCCPVDDGAACAQMELLADYDCPRAGIDAYADFVRRLESLVGAQPAPETQALHARIAAAVEETAQVEPMKVVLARDEVRRVVVLHVEPELGDEAELLEPQRHLGPLGSALDTALSHWGGRQFPVSGVALGAVFGLAEDSEQAPRRALRTALEVAALPAFQRARIGLCEGKALIAAAARQPIAGSILPTLAQRLAMCGDPGEVIVAATLTGALGVGIKFEPMARRRFTGLAGEHCPCRLVAATGTDGEPDFGAFATPFVGRWEELLHLTETMGSAVTKRHTLFLEVAGLAGTGKSRLLAEFARTHARVGGVVRWIGHRPELRHAALGAVRAYLRRQGDSMGNLSGRSLVEAVIARLFAPSGTRRPVLLVFDDLHWADETTRELLACAMLAPPTTPVLAVMACRPTAGTMPLADVPLPQLTLQPLSVPEATALIAAIDADGRLDNSRRSQLAQMSGGLPLCAEYIARAARDQVVSDASLFGVLQSVLDRMGPDKQVLQAASVLGRAFRGDGLRTLLPGYDMAPALKQAGVLAIVEHTGADSFAFHHALLRDCAYDSAPPQARRDWHRAAAGWLSQQPDAAPADIAQHYEAAHVWDAASDAWRRVAESAYLDEFPGEAKKAARRALAAAAKHGHADAADQAELELLCGHATVMTDGYGAKGAQKFFAPLAAAAGKLPNEIVFRALSGLVAGIPQGRTESLDMMRRLDAMACRPIHRVMVDYGYGSLLFWRGEFAESLRRLDAAIEIGATIPAREWLPYSSDSPVVGCLALKAANLTFSGTEAAAIAAADDAIALARREGRMHGLCVALTMAASVHVVLDRPLDAARLAGEGLEIANGRRFQLWQAYNTLFGFWSRARQGQFTVRSSFKLVSMHREFAAASRLSPVTSLWMVGCVFEALGHWTLLDATAKRALALAENGGDTFCLPDLLRQRALVRHASGDKLGARRLWEEACRRAKVQGSPGLLRRLTRSGERLTAE